MSQAADVHADNILIIDFGSQVTQLIARRVRENNVSCEIVRHDITAEQIKRHAPRGLILSGGPSSVNIRPRLPRGSAPLRFSWYTPFLISPHDPRTRPTMIFDTIERLGSKASDAPPCVALDPLGDARRHWLPD